MSTPHYSCCFRSGGALITVLRTFSSLFYASGFFVSAVSSPATWPSASDITLPPGGQSVPRQALALGRKAESLCDRWSR